MSATILVHFRLAADQPMRLAWLASDGAPGDGYKAQITGIRLMDGTRLAMDRSAILEQTAPDPAGRQGSYTLTFNGLVGFAADHIDRPVVESLVDQEVDYDLEIVHDESGKLAVENVDYRVVERPRAHARKLPG